MSRNYTAPTVSDAWANDRNTDMAVAVAIHAIADNKRTPEAIWELPTRAEWEHVAMAIEEYVREGDFEFDPSGYCWGQETVRIAR